MAGKCACLKKRTEVSPNMCRPLPPLSFVSVSWFAVLSLVRNDKLRRPSLDKKEMRKQMHRAKLAKCRQDDIHIRHDIPQGQELFDVLQRDDVQKEFARLPEDSLVRAVLEVKPRLPAVGIVLLLNFTLVCFCVFLAAVFGDESYPTTAHARLLSLHSPGGVSVYRVEAVALLPRHAKEVRLCSRQLFPKCRHRNDLGAFVEPLSVRTTTSGIGLTARSGAGATTPKYFAGLSTP